MESYQITYLPHQTKVPSPSEKQPLLFSLFGILVYALQVVFLRALPKPSQALLADFYTGLLIVFDPGLLADISGLAGFSALNATRRSPQAVSKYSSII